MASWALHGNSVRHLQKVQTPPPGRILSMFTLQKQICRVNSITIGPAAGTSSMKPIEEIAITSQPRYWLALHAFFTCRNEVIRPCNGLLPNEAGMSKGLPVGEINISCQTRCPEYNWMQWRVLFTFYAPSASPSDSLSAVNKLLSCNETQETMFNVMLGPELVM